MDYFSSIRLVKNPSELTKEIKDEMDLIRYFITLDEEHLATDMELQINKMENRLLFHYSSTLPKKLK